MKRYFGAQLKRLARLLPTVAVVGLILLAALAAVLFSFAKFTADSANDQKLRVAVTGDTNNLYFRMGMSMLQSMDSSRYTLEMVHMNEDEARRELEQGRISAYAVFPDGFMKEALRGNVLPVRCVLSAGSTGLMPLFKEEIAGVVELIMNESQKGVFALQDSLAEAKKPYGKHADRLAMKFVTVILNRDKMYTVEEIGVGDGLPVMTSLICGFAVLLLWLIGLPYASTMIRRDAALSRLLASNGYGALKQVTAEYAAYTAVLAPLTAAIAMGGLLFATDKTAGASALLVLRALPLLFLAAAFGLCVFSFVRDVVSGTLLAFFGAVALGYASGCLYPLYAFPPSVQALAPFLPTGLSRMYLEHLLLDRVSLTALGGVLLYTVLFWAIAVWLRHRRLVDRGSNV